MIVLVNGGPRLDRYGRCKWLGRLISPRCGNQIDTTECDTWAMDNDAYLAWDEGRFRKMLESYRGIPGCRFVAVPDVIGDWGSTLRRFGAWVDLIRDLGYPVAVVLQDGANVASVPWSIIDAVFIGGSTEFKLGVVAEQIAEEASRLGKWVHMGRVNTLKRIRHAKEIGCDSIDGTGWSMFPDVYLKRHGKAVCQANRQLILF